MNDEFVTVYYWPNGDWCYCDNLDVIERNGYDYGVVRVPVGVDESCIDEYVRDVI